jgi:signal transduction histidine kinase
MKPAFTISLQNRLSLTYTLFITAALALLALAINMASGIIFNALIKENIRVKSAEIAGAIERLYDPMTLGFDTSAVETLAMYFVHEGYIVSVEDRLGETVWNARACDMEQCKSVINEITSRMERQFRVNGGMRELRHTLQYNGKTAGAVIIESYGPFFYSETETKFLSSLNTILLTAGALLALLSVAVSIALSRAIALPINRAGNAARAIARLHARGGGSDRRSAVRIHDNYRTRELAELSRSINHLASELEEAERRQKRLVSDIAHELRTPLTCLQGTIEAMIDGVYAAGKTQLESCHEEIVRLASLVRDMDTLTSLEWEVVTLDKSEIDLEKLLRATAEQFRPSADEKGVKILLNLTESRVNADYSRLKQVFINIMSNAVKYTDKGSVTVAVRDLREDASGKPAPSGQTDLRWEVTIADTGAGIPEDSLPRIFERFYRADSARSRGTGGAGIGLAIAAAIVRAHNGTITAESNGGSLFRIRLP